MALLKRQTINLQIFDDQSPTLWGSFVGNWTKYAYDGFTNGTITATPTPGASLSFTFRGSQAWLLGGVANATGANGQIIFPTAEYLIDDAPYVGSPKPYIDSTGAVIYFETPKLADGTHEIDVTVKTANLTSPFIIDCFYVTPIPGGSNTGVGTSRGIPSPGTSTPTSTSTTVPLVTTQSTPVGAIVGGVVGGIAGIAILAIALWYFLRKRSRGGKAYYFDRPNAGDMLAGEDHHVEPFNATAATPAPSSAGFNGPGPRSAYSDGGSSQPLSPSVRQSDITGVTYVTGTTAQPRTGKAALMAQQYQNPEQPVQLEDSGIRFGDNDAGPSQLPNEVPPSYSAS